MPQPAPPPKGVRGFRGVKTQTSVPALLARAESLLREIDGRPGYAPELARDLDSLAHELYGRASHANATLSQLERAHGIVAEYGRSLADEIACSRVMAASPWNLGDVVFVLPPYVGHGRDGQPQYGRDEPTGLRGRVTAFATDAEGIRIFVEGRWDDFVPACRLESVGV